MAERVAELSHRILDFFAVLREEHAFSSGRPQAHDALRALELLGVSDRKRVRAILRAVACSSPEQIAIFEDAYDEVFLATNPGEKQVSYAPRHSRPAPVSVPVAESPGEERLDRPQDENEGESEGSAGPARERRISEDRNEALETWMTLRARYSAEAAPAEPPTIEAQGLDAMEAAARTFLRNVHLGRARRWTPEAHGPRFDLRRTLRASLQTGGDPVVLHRLGPPRRAPRFVVLIDGSRSMSEHAGALLQFAYALGRATRRVHTYVFSTGLHDLTRVLQATRPGSALPDLGESWGGGTRIGASLTKFVREHGPQVLDGQTLVIIASDGLDAGDGPQLERAMREIRRRSATIVWLNPHANSRGFTPSAAGMRAAIPFVHVLDAVADASDVERIAERLARGARREHLR